MSAPRRRRYGLLGLLRVIRMTVRCLLRCSVCAFRLGSCCLCCAGARLEHAGSRRRLDQARAQPQLSRVPSRGKALPAHLTSQHDSSPEARTLCRRYLSQSFGSPWLDQPMRASSEPEYWLPAQYYVHPTPIKNAHFGRFTVTKKGAGHGRLQRFTIIHEIPAVPHWCDEALPQPHTEYSWRRRMHSFHKTLW